LSHATAANRSLAASALSLLALLHELRENRNSQKFGHEKRLERTAYIAVEDGTFDEVYEEAWLG